jgi:hypothetical protein
MKRAAVERVQYVYFSFDDMVAPFHARWCSSAKIET